MSEKLHKLDSRDLQRMNIPEEFWKASMVEASEEIRPALQNYLGHFRELSSRGAGLLFSGPPGVGKTSAAVVLLKASRERYRTGYFTRIAELREALKNQHDFDADMSVMDRVREVDTLVLDAFSDSDLKAPWFRLDDLIELVAARGQRRRTTFITTALTETVLRGACETFFESLGTYLVLVRAKGSDRRAPEREYLANMIHGKKPTPAKKER